jgi:hypothetical protein
LGDADQRVVRQLVSAWLVLPPIMNTVHDIIRRAYELLVTGADFLRSPLLLALRVYFFWQLFLTGKGKLSNIGSRRWRICLAWIAHLPRRMIYSYLASK